MTRLNQDDPAGEAARRGHEEVCAVLESGSAFAAGEPLPGDPGSELLGRVREAVRRGHGRRMQRLLHPAFDPEFVHMEADDSDVYDGGVPRPSGAYGGELRALSHLDRFSALEGASVVAPFAPQTLLIPGQNAVRIGPGKMAGEVELTLTLHRPPAELPWTPSLLAGDFLLHCDPPDAGALDAYRTLGLGRWSGDGGTVRPRFGVDPPVGPLTAARSPAARLLAGVPPAGAARFLRLPARALAGVRSTEVRFRVHVGTQHVAAVVRALGGRVRTNCLPVWNAVTASDELPGDRPPALDPAAAGSVADRLLVLECLDPASGRCWHDRRFAGDRDPVETFEMANLPGGSGRVELRLAVPPDTGGFRVTYLAGQRTLGTLQSGVSRFVGPVRLIARSPALAAAGCESVRLAELPGGRAVTDAELVELVWRLAPTPVRERVATAVAAGRVGVRVEVRTAADGRAGPVTVVTLPARGDDAADLTYWLTALGDEAGRYTGGRVAVEVPTPAQAGGTFHG